jgi:hypothetical protein
VKTRGWYGRAAVYGGVGILVGLVLAAAVGPVIKAGRFVRWHRLSSPPVKLVALAACDDQRVYARTSSDTIYRCSSWDDSCWIRDEIPSSLRQSEFQLAGYRIEMTRPCNYSSSEFSWTMAPSSLVSLPRTTKFGRGQTAGRPLGIAFLLCAGAWACRA